MTPATTLIQLIEELPEDERQHVDEYIHFLYDETHSPSAKEFDQKYVDYIKAGIREGEEAYARGDVLDVEEGRKYLEELLNR